MTDPALFGPFFQGDWKAWRAFLAAVFGLEMGPNLRSEYERFTGRTDPPTTQADEAWMMIGRGGGKSRIAGLIATYLACFRDWRPLLAPGQLALIAIIAADMDQARVVFGYIKGLFEVVPALRPLLTGKATKQLDKKSLHLELRTGVRIEVRAASFRTIRGYSLVAAILDEIAYWMTGDTSLNPDHEIVNAMRPGLARIPGSMLIGLSSPYARKGVLYEEHEASFGKAGAPTLVWKATTRDMNPTFPQAAIDKALAKDAPKARAEYLAEFRDDLESYVSSQVVLDATVPGREELPPQSGVSYYAFTDPAGGSGQDDYSLAIVHTERRGERLVGIVDRVLWKSPPFSPEQTTADFAKECLRYGCRTVRGDKYAGEWPREQFGKHGVSYQVCDQTKSELYIEALPALNSRCVELLDVPRLTDQLRGLERRSGRSGKDTVDHAPGAHDDVVNAVMGALAPLVGGAVDAMGFFRFLEQEAGVTVATKVEEAAVVARQAESQWAGRTITAKPLTREERLAALDRMERSPHAR